MNKRRSLLLLLCLGLTAILLVVQYDLRQDFMEEPPRLEICFEGAIPSEAAAVLDTYDAYAEENRLVIEGAGKSVLFAHEVEDLLTGSGMDDFVLNDRTQADVLAEQSGTLWLFVSGILLLILLAELFYLDLRDLYEDLKDALRHVYLNEWLKERTEQLLVCGIRWALMAFIAIAAVRWLVACRFYIPAEVLPPESIFDLSHYLHIRLPSAIGSPYEQLCRSVLPKLYGLTALSAMLTTMATWMTHKLLRRHYAKKIHRREYHG